MISFHKYRQNYLIKMVPKIKIGEKLNTKGLFFTVIINFFPVIKNIFSFSWFKIINLYIFFI